MSAGVFMVFLITIYLIWVNNRNSGGGGYGW